MAGNGRSDGQGGAVVIHVAFALLALLAFTSFVVDYGIMWVARRQAQNVADGAALAGAIAYMVDGQTHAVVNRSAQHFAATNPIWGQANSPANVTVTLSGTPNPPFFDNVPPCGTEPGCVRVDVYRNMPDRYSGNDRGNPLPTFFGQLVGVVDQGVRATATAETAAGNMVRCLLPFAVADRWADATDENVDTSTYSYDGDHLLGDPIGGWSPNDLYQDPAGGGTDWYAPALAPLPPGVTQHTGWTVDGDYGRQLILKDGEVGQFSAGWANKVDLPGSNGDADFRADIKGCNNAEVGIAHADETCAGYPNAGTTLEEAKAGCLGVSSGLSVGPTKQGINGGGPGGLGVIEKDPDAVWNPTVQGPQGQTGAVVKSASDNTLNMSSERIRPVAIFDIAHYMQNPACLNQAGTGCVIKVANIVGFFVEGMCDEVKAAGRLEPGHDCAPNPEGRNQVVGRIVTLPASFAAGVGNVTEDAAFLKIVRLVR